MAKSTGFQIPPEADASIADTTAIGIDALEIEEVCLAELNNTLPIGIFLDGERLTSFTLKPYKTKYDRVLGEILGRPKITILSALQQFLPLMIETIGGIPLADLAQKLSTSPARLFGGMYLGDALSIVVSIRMAAQGPHIKMSATCPSCGTENEDKGTIAEPYHDLSGLPIKKIVHLSSDPVVEVRLKDGLEVGKEKLFRILMQPLKLHQFEAIAKPGAGAMDVLMLYEMVVGLPESEYYGKAKGRVFSDDLYDELTMADQQILVKAIERLQIVPKMEAEMVCIGCGHKWDAGLPWGNLRRFLFVPPEST
jgi:hypothetical protein